MMNIRRKCNKIDETSQYIFVNHEIKNPYLCICSYKKIDRRLYLLITTDT